MSLIQVLSDRFSSFLELQLTAEETPLIVTLVAIIGSLGMHLLSGVLVALRPSL